MPETYGQAHEYSPTLPQLLRNNTILPAPSQKAVDVTFTAFDKSQFRLEHNLLELLAGFQLKHQPRQQDCYSKYKNQILQVSIHLPY